MVNGPSRLDGPEGPSPFRESGRRVEGAVRVPPRAGLRDPGHSSARGARRTRRRGACARRARLAAALSLHFEYDDAINRVRVQVTNEDGEVVREIPPSALLDIAAGAEVQNAG